MRYLSGPPQEFANQTPTSRELIRFMVNDPDTLPTIRSLWQGDLTPFSTLLAERGLTSKGLFEGLSNRNYRVVGSNHVQYAIEHSDRRLLHFVKVETETFNGTYYCPAYPTTPGQNQSIVSIFLDSNWFSPKDVLELKDNKTLIYVCDDILPEEVTGGAWRYNVKIVTKDRTDFIDPALMFEGDEIGFAYTMFEHDLSETGYEKYTFDGWGHAYMTLQRMKYSYSGTAEAMNQSVYWTEHKGNITWLSYAQNQMMKRWAEANEYALIWGKGTVAVDGEVLMKDTKGREIMAGDGIINQGDGAFRFPYNNFTLKFLETIMQEMQIRAGNNGLTELVFIAGQQLYWEFLRLMKDIGVTDRQNIMGDGANKGIVNTYAYYEMGNVRLIPIPFTRWFDSPHRPKWYHADGTRNSSWEGIFVSLGNTESGQRGIELIQLRPVKTGAVHGINRGGDNMSNSVDGSHHHILFQSGVVVRNEDAVATIYRPTSGDRSNYYYYNYKQN